MPRTDSICKARILLSRGVIRLHQTFFISLLILILPLQALANSSSYIIGSGIADITGPAAEVGMMGYADIQQKTNGLRMRLFSRAFIIVDKNSAKRIVFVSADLGHVFGGVKQAVIKKLLKKGYGGRYVDENVMLSATHTHSGPGGYSHFALFNLSILGFNQANFDSIVDGITNSIIQADANLAEGKIYYNQGKLYQVTKNRSINAFYSNPLENRSILGGDETDNTMHLLRFEQDNKSIGLINWFAVHAVSMSKYNHLINGDNKGYASYLFEKSKDSNYHSKTPFVAAFAQSNEGDVSPNIFKLKNGENDSLRTELTGEHQYLKAVELYDTASLALDGDIDYRLQYINFSDYTIKPEFGDGNARHTCPSALGLPFTKGTSDGLGVTLSPMLVRGAGVLLSHPTPEEKACHSPKEIFLATANFKPWPWLPNVLPVQLFKLGSIMLVGVPGEFTTVAGENLRQTIAKALSIDPQSVIIAGLANSYSGYVTTHEEYIKQAYEGGFTIYGPWTLNAYQQAFHQLALDLKAGTPSAHGPNPLDLSREQLNFQTGVVYDNVPLWKKFGDVMPNKNVKASYKPGETVTVSFWGGHPKNNHHPSVKEPHRSFLYVQQWQNGHWQNLYDDNDWNTIYQWQRYGLDASKIDIKWMIPKDASPGLYRIVHQGYYKNGFSGKIHAYSGHSNQFRI